MEFSGIGGRYGSQCLDIQKIMYKKLVAAGNTEYTVPGLISFETTKAEMVRSQPRLASEA